MSPARTCLWAAIPLWTLSAVGQSSDPALRVRSEMQSSLERQRESVERQLKAVKAGSDFFLSPWLPPAGVQAIPPVIPPNPDPGPAATAAPPADRVHSTANCDALPKGTLDRMIDQAALRQGLDAAVLRAVVQKESGGRPCAVSPKGALGLMQLMPATADQFQVFEPFEPIQNLEAGSRYLKQLLDRYDGNLEMALGAYNAGPARVDQQGAVPNIRETIRYVADILAAAGIR